MIIGCTIFIPHVIDEIDNWGEGFPSYLVYRHDSGEPQACSGCTGTCCERIWELGRFSKRRRHCLCGCRINPNTISIQNILLFSGTHLNDKKIISMVRKKCLFTESGDGYWTSWVNGHVWQLFSPIYNRSESCFCANMVVRHCFVCTCNIYLIIIPNSLLLSDNRHHRASKPNDLV